MSRPQIPALAPAARLLLGVVLLLSCGSDEPRAEGVATAAAASAPAPPAAAADGAERFGDGFVVWESNRTGRWRIWTVRLDGSGLARLSPKQGGDRHCCPHISPDGSRIAYLSFPPGPDDYVPAEGSGVLHLIRPDGSGDRVVAPAARTYFEHRAAVWRSARELIFIGGDGRTQLLDVDSGDLRPLTHEPLAGPGWLINSTLTWAANGFAVFAPYDPARGAVAVRDTQRGCQPYFSHDGRWGFWTAGAGGPVDRLELESGAVSTILGKNDERMPPGLGYLYFPMFSRDGMMFAVGASAGGHDHFRSDYEIFVAESDPRTLELVGPPVRMTFDGGTDRFPDVYLAPLALGRHFVEAPHRVALDPGAAGDWEWDFGDGGRGRGPRGVHTCDRPGAYTVAARRGDAELRGRVVVRPPRPPRPVGIRLADLGAKLVVSFDEEVRPAEPRLALESGRPIRQWSLAPDGRAVVVEPAAPLEAADRLRISGFADRSQSAYPMEPAVLAVEPPLWPSDRTGLVWLWETGDAPNLVPDPALGVDRACTLDPVGRAWLDRHFAMDLQGGYFAAGAEDSARVHLACRGTNQLTVEAMARPRAGGGEGLRTLVALAASGHGESFTLAQIGDRLVLRLRVSWGGPGAVVQTELARLPADRASHVAVTFAPGRLEAYVEGERVLRDESIHADFYHWQPGYGLALGGLAGGGWSWSGVLEGVALYSRVLPAAEIAENHLRYRSLLRERPPVERVVAEARLLRKSRPPTLAEITPYDEALVAFEYEVTRVVEGRLDGDRVRVAHWSILDREIQPVNDMAPGTAVRLTLEPFAANPQLASFFISDTLDAEATLYFSVGG